MNKPLVCFWYFYFILFSLKVGWNCKVGPVFLCVLCKVVLFISQENPALFVCVKDKGITKFGCIYHWKKQLIRKCCNGVLSCVALHFQQKVKACEVLQMCKQMGKQCKKKVMLDKSWAAVQTILFSCDIWQIYQDTMDDDGVVLPNSNVQSSSNK